MTKRLRVLAPVVVAGLVLGGCSVAVASEPALADVSGEDPPDYVLEEDGTVLIDGDLATDCTSFASSLEQGYFESGDISPGAQRMLDQCERAGLLPSEGITSGASPGASASSEAEAADGEDGGLPDTSGPDLQALLLAVSSVLATTSGLLAHKVATG
jgi:hypothetical protein